MQPWQQYVVAPDRVWLYSAMMIIEYTMPGEDIFPEGITEDPDGNTFYVSSSRQGTIFRGRVDDGALAVWQPGGVDGRTTALGLAVDGHGRLLVCGSETGYLFCYDTASGALVDRVRVPVGESLLNDVCVAGGYAYVTDSKRPVLWRVRLGERVGEPDEWIDLGEAELTPYLNGIVELHDGATLLVAAQGTEVLWRVDVASKAAEKVDLGGLRLAADGMVVVDGLLYTCDNVEEADGTVRYFLSALRLTADARAGELVGRWERPMTDSPTTVAHLGGRFYVVNSQFSAVRLGTATAPFTVSALVV